MVEANRFHAISPCSREKSTLQISLIRTGLKLALEPETSE